MNKAFEQIALIPGVIAAALVSPNNQLAGWCANSAIAPDNLAFIGVTCRAVLSASRAEQRDVQRGWAVFGSRTLVFHESSSGLFLAYLDSIVDDSVLEWLFAQIKPLLAGEGLPLD